ncbi:MAG: VOC family protein, partial [Ilumatobacter sp.]
RHDEHWVDFDLYGHQIVAHLDESSADRIRTRSDVDGDAVPVPHFGLLLEPDDWEALASRLRDAGTQFVIEPHVRFVGQAGEQSTMFLLDPSGNALEFKSFADDAQVFAR